MSPRIHSLWIIPVRGSPASSWPGRPWPRPRPLPGQGRKKRRKPVRESGRGGDPTAFGPASRELMAARGWQERAAVGGVFGRWPQIVGPELAEHTKPETFEDGVLVIAADSASSRTCVARLAAS